MAKVIFCDGCGAPLDAPWSQIVIVCDYCGAQNLPGQPTDPVPSSMPADGRPRLNIGGRTYLVEGRIARGDSCDAYRARWVRRLGELVVIKVLRSLSDEDLLRREYTLLSRLQQSRSQGAEHFVTRVPEPIAMGPVNARGTERQAVVYRWRSGFMHTLVDVRRVHPLGVDGRVATWIAKRLAELVGWLHAEGVVHGAVIPPHVVVHPLDHGANLVGWGVAASRQTGGFGPLLAVSREWAEYYPAQTLQTGSLDRTTDIVMAARCALAAWGEHPSDPHLPDRISGPVAVLLRSAARGEIEDAWAFRDAIDTAAKAAWGPPTYNPLPMPGW